MIDDALVVLGRLGLAGFDEDARTIVCSATVEWVGRDVTWPAWKGRTKKHSDQMGRVASQAFSVGRSGMGLHEVESQREYAR